MREENLIGFSIFDATESFQVELSDQINLGMIRPNLKLLGFILSKIILLPKYRLAPHLEFCSTILSLAPTHGVLLSPMSWNQALLPNI